jgi:alkanesulfonate monooxygenase SsuD/methylene tetrahydromethanopterin reductase-like flavin-dependent oxidoreductase (luciferase family)
MRAVWDSDHASYEGEFANFSGISVNPKPVNGRVPIHIGGHTEAAAHRAGRLGDGFIPGEGDLAVLISTMNASAEEAGRDPSAIEVSAVDLGVMGEDPVAAAEKMAARGVTRLGVPGFLLALAPDPVAAIAEFGEKVIAPTADL